MPKFSWFTKIHQIKQIFKGDAYQSPYVIFIEEYDNMAVGHDAVVKIQEEEIKFVDDLEMVDKYLSIS